MSKESLWLIWVKRDKTYGIMPTKMHIKCLLQKKSISPLIKFLQHKEINTGTKPVNFWSETVEPV